MAYVSSFKSKFFIACRKVAIDRKTATLICLDNGEVVAERMPIEAMELIALDE